MTTPLPCNFGYSMRKHEEETAELDRLEDRREAYANELLNGKYSPENPENFAEALSELFHGSCSGAYAKDILRAIDNEDGVFLAGYIRGMASGYWVVEAEKMARREIIE